MLHPALDGEIGDGYPVAYLLLIGHRPSRRTGLDAEDAVDPGHCRPHCRPVFKVPTTSSAPPRRQRSGPGGERIPDQRPKPASRGAAAPAPPSRPADRSRQNQHALRIIHHCFPYLQLVARPLASDSHLAYPPPASRRKTRQNAR